MDVTYGRLNGVAQIQKVTTGPENDWSIQLQCTRKSRCGCMRRILPCARVKNRNSRQPLADEMTLEEVPKKRRPGALTGGAPGQTMPCFMSRQPSRWLREGRSSVERKSADGARENVPSPEAGGSDSLLRRMHYFALPCVRG